MEGRAEPGSQGGGSEMGTLGVAQRARWCPGSLDTAPGLRTAKAPGHPHLGQAVSTPGQVEAPQQVRVWGGQRHHVKAVLFPKPSSPH